MAEQNITTPVDSQPKFVGVVYMAFCNVNGKSYIGQTFRQRCKEPIALLVQRRRKHFQDTRDGSSLPFHNALRKHGEAAFTWCLLAVRYDQDSLTDAEAKFISDYRTSVDENGYNAICPGPPRRISSQTKQLMSRAAKARWSDPERRKQVTIAIQRGKQATRHLTSQIYSTNAKERFAQPDIKAKCLARLREVLRSDDYRKKRSEVMRRSWAAKPKEERERLACRLRETAKYARTRIAAIKSPEYRKKKSEEGRRRYARPFTVYNAQTGHPIKRFVNITDAATYFNAHASNVSASLRGTAGSFGRPKGKGSGRGARGKYTARWDDE